MTAEVPRQEIIEMLKELRDFEIEKEKALPVRSSVSTEHLGRKSDDEEILDKLKETR